MSLNIDSHMYADDSTITVIDKTIQVLEISYQIMLTIFFSGVDVIIWE